MLSSHMIHMNIFLFDLFTDKLEDLQGLLTFSYND